MAALPYIQLYVAEYLADTMHLTAEEHGAYLLLIFNYWQTGKSIPKKRLQAIARLDRDRWETTKDNLSDFFDDDGVNWVHPRIEKDLASVNSTSEKKSTKPTYLYFATDSDSQKVVVAFSKNPWARLKQLRSSYGSSTKVVATLKVGSSHGIKLDELFECESLGDAEFSKSDRIKALIDGILEEKVTTPDELVTTVVNYSSTKLATKSTTNKDKDKDKDKDITTTPPNPPEGEGETCSSDKAKSQSEILAERFNIFWQAYPKKKSKGQAETTWKKIKPSEQLLQAMLSAIEQAKTSIDWTKDQGQFIPHPSTWLNAKGWEDDYLQPIQVPHNATNQSGTGYRDSSSDDWFEDPEFQRDLKRAGQNAGVC